MKMNLITFFIISLFLTACGPGQILGPTITMTPTMTATPTITPTSTPSPTPTSTQTPSPTPTIIGGYLGRVISISGGKERHLEIYLKDINSDEYQKIWESPNNLTVDGNIDAKWSPDGEVIAVEYFMNGSYLTLVKYTGEEIITINTKKHYFGGLCDHINWSNDGRYLFFESVEKGYQDVYRISKDGKEITQITNTYSVENCPRNTFDENVIYFHIGGATFFQDLLSGEVENFPELNNGVITDWSPDGKTVLFNSRELYFYNFENNLLTKITNDGKEGQESEAWFSPDGKWIMYVSFINYTREDYFIVPSDLSSESRLIAEGVISAEFLPDNTGIIYYQWLSQDGQHGSEGIFIDSMEGGNAVKIENGGEQSIFGYWSMIP